MHASSWLIRLIAWDGLLPALVWLSPHAIRAIIPNHDKAIEAAAILIPIAALFLRFYMGSQYIYSNHCSRSFRRLQVVLFCLGIFLLLLIDVLLILSTILPKMPPGHPVHFKEMVLFTGVFAVYLLLMIIAMYPGPADIDTIE